MRIPKEVYVSSLSIRVGYVDTDKAQVVHHGTYLRYLEASRVEYLRERNIDYKRFEVEDQLALPVVEAKVRYRAPARFDDLIVVKTWVGQVTRAKVRFDSLIYRADELLTSAEITLCCIKVPEQKLCSMPSTLLALHTA